jgi:hypothetical protein
MIFGVRQLIALIGCAGEVYCTSISKLMDSATNIEEHHE